MLAASTNQPPGVENIRRSGGVTAVADPNQFQAFRPEMFGGHVSVQQESANRAGEGPDDPLFGKQWYWRQVGTEVSGGWWQLFQIADGLPIPAESKDIVVAVLDSGVNLEHPELLGRLWTDPTADDGDDGCIGNRHGIAYLPWGYPCQDLEDTSAVQHGTTVTGVMAAHANNGLFIAGGTPERGVKFMIVKIIQPSGVVNYSDILLGLQYADKKGADIISMSFAAWPPVTNAAVTGIIAEINALLTKLHGKGVILIAGSGNSGDPNDRYYEPGVGWPAIHPGVIAVTGYGLDGKRPAFASTGPEVALAASAVKILTICYDGTPYNDVCEVGGTSYAAPQVTAVAILTRMLKRDTTPDEFRKLLSDTARPTTNPGLGYGYLDLGAIADRLQPPPPVHRVFVPFVKAPMPKPNREFRAYVPFVYLSLSRSKQ